MKTIFLTLILALASYGCLHCRQKANSTIADDYTEKLIKASENGDLEVVKKLAESGANLNAKRGGGFNPDDIALKVAAEYGHDAVFEFLISKGATIHDWAGESVLRVAARNKRITIVKYLLEQKISVNSGKKNFTPLMESVRSKNNLEIMKLLIERGAIIDDSAFHPSGFNETALMLAAEHRNAQAIKLLLDHKAAPNGIAAETSNISGDRPDWTPLMNTFNSNHYDYAAADHIKSIEYLMAAGADANRTDAYGCTALDYSRHNDFPAAGAYLASKGGKRGQKCQAPPSEEPDDHSH